MTKGEYYKQVIHMKVPHWNMVAVLMSKLNGVTVESVIREAFDCPDEQVKCIKGQANKAIKALKAPTTSNVAGKVTTDLTFEEVPMADEVTSVYEQEEIVTE